MRYMVFELTTPEEGVPHIVYCEIDDSDYEVRKVGIYTDGSLGYATMDAEVGGVRLSDQETPSVEGINKSIYRLGKASSLSKEDFERIWSEYTNK